MKILPSIAMASAIALTVAAPARAQSASDIANAEAALNFLQRLGIQYMVLAARTAVDLTYDSMSIDTRNSEAVLNGVMLRPKLDWDPERQCEIHIDRLAMAGSTALDTIDTAFEISGATVPTVCLDPGAGAMLQSFGYPVLDISRVSATIGYDLPSSSATALVSADITEAAEVIVAADFDYVYVTGILDPETGGEPQPVALLHSAEVVIENAGLWERVSPMLGAQFGDLNQLPAMVGPMLGSVLAPPGQPLGAAEQALLENISGELARFIANGDRLVLSMEPDGGAWLTEETFITPQAAIAALQPSFSSAPLAAEMMIATDVLTAALGGGAGLDDAEKLVVGEALITGIGAPRAPTEGKALVQPLAEAWNPLASQLLGEALADEGADEAAYAMALRALAGGAEGALGLADDLEASLETGAVLAGQQAVLAAWPDLGAWQSIRQEAEQSGNVPALRRLAFAAAAGNGAPRSYAEAYYLASLAAAAGDVAAVGLRDRLDRRFTSAGTLDADWARASAEAGSAALRAWTEGGVGDRVSAAYGR